MKSSRSMNSTQAPPWSRPVRASAWISRSRHSARFASPVSGSCSASWRIRSSPRNRPSAVASTFAIARRKLSSSSPSEPSTPISPNTSSPGGDLEPRQLAAVVPPAGQQLAGAPDLHEVERERLAHPLDRLDGQVADVGARQRPLAQPGHRGRLGRLALQPRHRLAVHGHVAPDREQQRARLGLHDPPAHLAHELGAVAAQAVGADREPQRMLGREVELHVARVAVADRLRPQRLDRLAEQLPVFVSEQCLGVRVDEDDASVTPGGDRRVRQSFQHRPQRAFLVEQRLQCAGLLPPGLVVVRFHAAVGAAYRARADPSRATARWRVRACRARRGPCPRGRAAPW